MRRHRAPSASLLLLALLLAGCGGGGLYAPGPGPGSFTGSVYVDNLGTENVDTFYVAPVASDAWSEELLGWPLTPGESAYVGDFVEDSYDAEADLELGDLVQWFDVYVPADDATTFEVW